MQILILAVLRFNRQAVSGNTRQSGHPVSGRIGQKADSEINSRQDTNERIFPVFSGSAIPALINHGINLTFFFPYIRVAPFDIVAETTAVCHLKAKIIIIHDHQRA